MLSLTDFFAFLGAPLANQRWSWGAERKADGVLFLRVWQDECRNLGERRAVRITAEEFFADRQNNLGYQERRRHLELIQSGCQTYLVMCAAVDPKAEPRTIAHYNDRELFVAGELIAHDGDYWLELLARKPASALRPRAITPEGRK